MTSHLITAPKSQEAKTHSSSEPKQQWVQEMIASVFLGLTGITSWRARRNILRQQHRTMAISWGQNKKAKSRQRQLTTWRHHYDTQRGFQWDNPAHPAPCNENYCVTFTHSACEWEKGSAVRLTVVTDIEVQPRLHHKNTVEEEEGQKKSMLRLHLIKGASQPFRSRSKGPRTFEP